MIRNTDTVDEDGRIERAGVSRRRVLRTVGGTGVGVAVGAGALAGVASANEVAEVEFCGYRRVVVRGAMLLGSDCTDEESGYTAVLSCGGSVRREPLTGTCEVQSYDLADDGLDPGSCAIIAVEGETYSRSDSLYAFRICNEHCGYECAEPGLSAAGFSCDDPDSLRSGGGSQEDSFEETTISVVCDDRCITTTENEGCTPGYWKQPARRTGAWEPTGYDPDRKVTTVFDLAVTDGSGRGEDRGEGRGRENGRGESRGRGQGSARDWTSMTLSGALEVGGGPGVEGAQAILLRAAVAALLNASHPDVEYPRTAREIIDAVNAVLSAGSDADRGAILDLAEALDDDNNSGCPLDGGGSQ